MQELRQTLNNAIRDFSRLLPPNCNEESWRELYPLSGIAVCLDDEEFKNYIDNWEKFLDNLDKLWNRMNAYALSIDDIQKKNSIQGFLGNVNNKRTTDDLLIYLDQARNSVQHTLWRHLRTTASQEVVSDGKGVTISINNGFLNVQSRNGETISEIALFNDGTVLLKEVKSKDTMYYLPEKHNNNYLHALDRALPHMIGKHGLLFYEDVLKQMEQRVNK